MRPGAAEVEINGRPTCPPLSGLVHTEGVTGSIPVASTIAQFAEVTHCGILDENADGKPQVAELKGPTRR